MRLIKKYIAQTSKASKGKNNNSTFVPFTPKTKSLVDQPLSVLEEVQKESPLKTTERLALQFADVPGAMDYLSGKGYKPVLRDGEIYLQDLEDKQKLYPVDPSMFDQISQGEYMEAFKDLPADYLEAFAESPEMAGEAAGTLLGAAASASTGTPPLLTVPAFAAAGTSAGEGVKQLLGKLHGLRKGGYDPKQKGC